MKKIADRLSDLSGFICFVNIDDSSVILEDDIISDLIECLHRDKVMLKIGNT